MQETVTKSALQFDAITIEREEVLNDYRLACISRELSILGRKEALSGKANFGIFGDGKEVAQVIMAKFFKKGDWRSGYYRDQTFMLATGLLKPEEFFYQIYGDTNHDKNATYTGKNFNNHYYTANIDENGDFLELSNLFNSSADVSPTSGQMPRLLGLGYASKLFRKNNMLQKYPNFSRNGNEVALGTIGESSTAEGLFWETLNAACVLQIPVALAIYDDGYGISVPVSMQTTKANISLALKGFERDENGKGCIIYTVKGWDYPGLIKAFAKGFEVCRKDHVPVVFHIQEMIQHLGHSTSGSHERYKSKSRLNWEKIFDPIKKMKEWILSEKFAAENEVLDIEIEAKLTAKEAKETAWQNYISPFIAAKKELIRIINQYKDNPSVYSKLTEYHQFINNKAPNRKDLVKYAKNLLFKIVGEKNIQELKTKLKDWISNHMEAAFNSYNRDLYIENSKSALKVEPVSPLYSSQSKMVNGREILNRFFDIMFEKNPLLVTFGEDTGKIGDVNQVLKGLQEKYGNLRITDTGIREATIIGQGIGMALRGLRPVAEIQYLDYLIFALQTMSDDLATTHYRTNGQQVAPVIIRTRGHRLEGMWHSGSPMGMLLNSVRGIYICVPRNMVKAAGLYNTLLSANDPGLVIEPLRGYQEKEKLPDNIGEYNIPLGIPEIIKEGTDVTLVTYGWNVKIAGEAAEKLEKFGISVELIDVQTLIPFDLHHIIKKSVQKTNHLVFLDEDVPGGATAYMMQKVLEEQKAFYDLDSPAQTITAKDHRPAYGSDGDYFSKPNKEMIFETIYGIMHERYPEKFAEL